MKRWLMAILATIFLLSGCGKEIGETISNEGFEAESCILWAETEMDFGYFRAQPAQASAAEAEALFHQTLELYPEGFWEQLGDVQVVLTGTLTGSGEFAHGHYAGFTQRTGDGWLLVLDGTACDAGTIHHEIAHILDGILTEAGTLTEESWLAYCPDGFVYGEGDWSEYPDFFVDAYAMQNIKEDRARTYEAAVSGGPGVFSDAPALWLKHSCFCEAIRAHFDTRLWPAKTIWELALE